MQTRGLIRALGLAAAPLAMAATLVAAPTPSEARELRIATGTASKNALNRQMDRFAELVEEGTEGAYTGKTYPGTLVSFAEMINAVRDGIVDVGYIVTVYDRAGFPYTNLLTELSTLSTDPVVMGAAMNDYMFGCAECLAEAKAKNQVFLGFVPAGPYYLMSRGKVASQADFEGMTIRGLGPFGRWVEAMGGKAVVIPSGDIYEALNQGSLDGNTQGLDTLVNLSYGEIVDYVLDLPIGLFHGSAPFQVNRDLWAELSAEQKRVFAEAAGASLALSTVGYFQENDRYREHPEDAGVEMVAPDAALLAATEAFRQSDLETVVQTARDTLGIEDADARIARMQELIAKWTGIFEGVDVSDVDAVAEIYVRELFSKIDVSAL